MLKTNYKDLIVSYFDTNVRDLEIRVVAFTKRNQKSQTINYQIISKEKRTSLLIDERIHVSVSIVTWDIVNNTQLFMRFNY